MPGHLRQAFDVVHVERKLGHHGERDVGMGGAERLGGGALAALEGLEPHIHFEARCQRPFGR